MYLPYHKINFNLGNTVRFKYRKKDKDVII